MFVASITNTNLGGISPNSSIFFSISMLFPVFTNRWEEVTWKRRKTRFRVEQVWTLKSGYTEHWGIQRAGPLPSPPPSQKKRGGVREGSLSRNWPLCEWNIYDRRTHSAFKIRSSTSLKMKLEFHDHFNNSWPYKIPYQERILSSLDDVLSLACSNLPLTKMARKMETLRNGEKYHLGKNVVTCQEV